MRAPWRRSACEQPPRTAADGALIGWAWQGGGVQSAALTAGAPSLLQVVDCGSLNGTTLNGEPISTPNRQPGRAYRLSSDDILQASPGVGAGAPPAWGSKARVGWLLAWWAAAVHPRSSPPPPPSQLGTHTKIRISTFPRDLLDPMQQRHGSLPGARRAPPPQAILAAPACAPPHGTAPPVHMRGTSPLLAAVGSMPKSLTMPKHRIPSFTSLLSPKARRAWLAPHAHDTMARPPTPPPSLPQITNTPSQRATVAAASDELRLECCIVSRTGRDHARRGQGCEVRVGYTGWPQQ